MTDLRSVAVVGVPLAGLCTVDALRRSGFDGDVTVVDAAPILPSDRPPLSKQVLRGESSPGDHPQLVARRLDELAVDLRLGISARALDVASRRLDLSDGDTVTADAIVIATGAHARRLPLGQLAPFVTGSDDGVDRRVGVPSDEALVLRDDADAIVLAEELAESDGPVVIVGAGFIGAEVAAASIATGHPTTLIDIAATPMQRVLPAPIGEWVRRLLVDRGVDVRTSTAIEDVVRGPDGSVARLVLSGGSTVPASVVVAGIGAAPNVDWLGGSGLTLDNGVVCDETLCAAPGIFAAGDVANVRNVRLGRRIRVEQWENAVDQGTYLGSRLLTDTPEPYAGLPWFWSDLFESKLQLAGAPEPDDEVIVVDGSLDEDRFVALFRRGEWCSGVVGVGRPRLVMIARRQLAEPLRIDDALALYDS